MPDILVKAQGLSKKFCKNLKHSILYGIQDITKNMVGILSKTDNLKPDEFWAVDNISFELRRGECLGLIGPNGSGKSTLLKILNGIISPDKGRVEIRGKVGALIEVGAGFHPMLTGRENVYINGSILGMTAKELDDNFEDIIKFAEIDDFIDTPVKYYSSGMYVRLGFSIAVFSSPDILLIDEALAVGDYKFQFKCFNHIGWLLRNGTSIIFVSHNRHQVSRICSACIYLNKGKVKTSGDTGRCLDAYFRDISKKTIHGPELPRAGSHPSLIRSFKISDINGNEKTNFLPGDGFQFSVHFDPGFKIIKNVKFELLFWLYDQTILALSTENKIQWSSTIDSPGKLIFTIPEIALAPGTYEIAFGFISIQNDNVIDWFPRHVPVKVLGEKNPLSLLNLHYNLTVTNSSHA